jgi:hypothetical protein
MTSPTPPPSRFEDPHEHEAPPPLTPEQLHIEYLRQRLNAQIDETGKTWAALQTIGRQKVEADLALEATLAEVAQVRGENAHLREELHRWQTGDTPAGRDPVHPG